MSVLELNHVSKRFGEQEVIKELTFSVKEHSVFGFIGKNGAGKTTTMKMILGFLQPDKGEIQVCSEKVVYGRNQTNRYIGYLPDVPEYYSYMTPKEYLRLCGEITGIGKEHRKERSKELLSLVGLDGVNKRIGGFSRGMKQRLGIAQALLNEPRVLICDEPTSALDPVGRKDILDILSYAKEKTTIVFSTHILSDVERICDNIGILSDGKLVLEGPVNEIKNNYRTDSVLIEIPSGVNIDDIVANLKKLSVVQSVSVKQNQIVAVLSDADQDGLQIMAYLVSEQIPVLRYEILEPDLENVFLEVIK